MGAEEKLQNLVYYDVRDLRIGNAKPIVKWERQFKAKHGLYVCNNNSKFSFYSKKPKSTVEFSYFDLRNNPKGEIRKVKGNKDINIIDYQINKVREVEPNVYLIVYKKYSKPLNEE